MHRRAFVFAGSAIAARKKSYHHGDLRRVLLEATLKWVERDGLSGFSLRALARKAETTPASQSAAALGHSVASGSLSV